MIDPRIPFKRSLPGIESLPGVPTVDLVGGPVCKYLDRETHRTWSELGELTPEFVLDLSHMGAKRLDNLITNVVNLLGIPPTDPLSGSTDPVASAEVIDPRTVWALQSIASWAAGTDKASNLLDAIDEAHRDQAVDAPKRALEALRDTPVSGLAVTSMVLAHDPVRVARDIIASFDARELDVLDRVLDLDNSAPTLEQLGDRHGVTRERIRQIELKVRSRLDESVTRADRLSLVAAADQLAERLGAAVPLVELKRDFARFPPDLVDRLILHLAGPYRLHGDWVVSRDFHPMESALLGVFEATADNGWTPLDTFLEALGEAGVRREYRQTLIDSSSRLRTFADSVIDWRGSMACKARRILDLTGEAMTVEQLAAIIGPDSAQGLSNQLGSAEDLRRVGPGRFALAEWDMSDYRGIVPAMVDRLEEAGGPLRIADLGAAIAAEYGASPASVSILAGTHPAFVTEAGNVRLRPEGEPYVPTQRLSETPRCYRVDGAWAWRFPVDRDTLRGSGRAIPESFAVHLGLMPLERGRVHSPFGELSMRWLQSPTIGTTRAAARELEADEGDQLFLVSRSASTVEFLLLRSEELPDDPEQRLRRLVGAPDAGDLAEVLADALDLPGAQEHELAESKALLEQRKEKDLVALLDLLSS